MSVIDSHAHLTFKQLAGDVDAYLTRAQDAGVEHIITIGTDLDDCEHALALAKKHDCVSAAVGVHPHEADKVDEADWDRLASLIQDDQVVAVGEMGLDYHYDLSDRNAQRRVFERQLAMASDKNRPIVIHCREAHRDTVDILKAHGFTGQPVVFHCFTGTIAEEAELRDNGWRISFTGVVTFKNAGDVREIAITYPEDALMIETDSPYLSPVPVRHMRPNEPANVVHIAQFLADLRGVDFDTIARQTTENTRQFFHLS